HAIGRSKCFSTASVGPELIDQHGRVHNYLRISITERCNLRCTYCMPINGITLTPRTQLLTEDEIVRLARIFVTKLSVTKIRLTGGEPLVDRRLLNIIKQLNSMRSSGLQTIAMTTNAVTLKHKYESLFAAGLDNVNISLDTLKESKFEQITRRKGHANVVEAIKMITRCKPDSIKLNCVVIKGVNDDELCDFVELTRDQPITVRFIEYMPFDDNGWLAPDMVRFREMLEKINRTFEPLVGSKLVPIATVISEHQCDSERSTSKIYHIPGFMGRVGFVSSMSENFCSGCNRLRITADGFFKASTKKLARHFKLANYSCLFGADDASLRDLIRNGATDDEIVKCVRACLWNKAKQHAGARQLTTSCSSAAATSHGSNSSFYDDSTSRGTTAAPTLSHLDSKGQAIMVDVSNKQLCIRVATACGRIHVGDRVLRLMAEGKLEKGDVGAVAKVAAIGAAKQTSHLIPMCHQIGLNCVSVDIETDLESGDCIVRCSARSHSVTGVEMESLVGTLIALATIYDMCKKVNPDMVIKDVKIIKKSKTLIASS
ncbi:Molybdenum cofactor biosynthesis protein 1, partial [Fragariocoptes setiger]